MLNSIMTSTLKARFLVLFAAAALLVVGGIQLSRKSFDLLPEFSPPGVEVQTEAIGLAAAEVEALITVPLEEILSGVPWLQSMDSTSIDGLSSIVMRFDPDTDVMAARQMVQERLLHSTKLPKVAKRPVMLQPVSSTNRVMNVGLSSDTLSLTDISVLARWHIKPRLMGLPGVANVAIWGQRERQLQVLVDPSQLAEKGVLLKDVIKATGDALYSSPLTFLQASTPGTGGFIDTPNQRLDIRHVLPISTPAELAKVAFLTQQGSVLQLADVAEVVEGHPIVIGDGMVDEEPALLLVVEKFPWANTLDVTMEIEATLETMAPGLSGLDIDTSTFRPASFIEMSIGNIAMALAIGGVLAIAALAAGLLQWRPVLVGVLAMALSLTTAMVVLFAFGTAFNAMVLAGLVGALALVIRDAVTDAHGIASRLRANAEAGSPETASSAILQAASETKGSVLNGTLVCVAVILPVLTLGGLYGAFTRPVVLAFLVMTVASILVAVVVTPALSLVLMSGARGVRATPPWLLRLQARYDAFMVRQLKAQGMSIALAAVTACIGLAALPLVNYSLFPVFEERDFLMRWRADPGISYPAMSRLTREAGQAIRAVPGVRGVGAHIGRAIESDRVEGIGSAELWVSVDPDADYTATVAAVERVASGFPGLHPEAVSFSTAQIERARAEQAEAVRARIYGPEPNVLRSLAEEVTAALSGVEGVDVLPAAETATKPELEIEVDLALAEQHGLSPGEIRRAATTLLAGLEVGTLYEDQKVFEVMVWGVPAIRDELADVGELLIDTPDGGQVRLSDVADVRMSANPTVLERRGASHVIDVDLQVSGDMSSTIAEIERALATVEFPLEYHPEVLVEGTGQAGSLARLLVYSLTAAVGIFLLLQAACGSWRMALVAFVALPASMAGGVLISLIGGGTIYLGSLIGLLAVLGIASRDVLSLVQYGREVAPSNPAPAEAAARIASERFGPVVLSVLTTGLAFLPLAVLGTRPGLEILHPMALTILGGLATTTAVTLFLVPACLAGVRLGPSAGAVEGMSHA